MSATPSWRSTRGGKFLALRVNTKANIGAYMSTFSSSIPTYLYATLLAGQYKTPAIYCDVQAYYTNTVPVDAYRGAGPARGLVPARDPDGPGGARDRAWTRPSSAAATSSHDAFPYQTPVALMYDIGNYEATLDEALKLADYAGFAAPQGRERAARQAARHRHLLLHRGLRHRALGAWWARSAPASGCGRAARCASPPPARCR